jgi:lipoprotein-releasing system permease protein
MSIYAPQREGQLDLNDPTSGFVADSLMSPGVVFAVHQGKYDKGFIVTSIAFARNLFGQQGMLTSLELRIKEGNSLDAVKRKIQKIAGDKYRVLDRYEQQADTFRIMQIEKFIAYIFLTFILLVATFNIIGSLSMLIIEKKNDVQTLRNLGADNKHISQIFRLEGQMITAIGAIAGIVIGLLLCWLQQTFGLIRLGNESGSFIVNAYPVSVHYTDVVIIFITVMAVGWLSTSFLHKLTD